MLRHHHAAGIASRITPRSWRNRWWLWPQRAGATATIASGWPSLKVGGGGHSIKSGPLRASLSICCLLPDAEISDPALDRTFVDIGCNKGTTCPWADPAARFQLCRAVCSSTHGAVLRVQATPAPPSLRCSHLGWASTHRPSTRRPGGRTVGRAATATRRRARRFMVAAAFD